MEAVLNMEEQELKVNLLLQKIVQSPNVKEYFSKKLFEVLNNGSCEITKGDLEELLKNIY